MSSLKVHALQGAAATAALYPVIGNHALTVGLASVFIDVDHVVDYVHNTRCYDVRGLFVYSDLIEENLDKNYLVLSAFHTIEFVILLLCLTPFFPELKYVLAGMALHMAADLYHMFISLRQPFARAYSLLEYLYRSRSGKYVTTVRELVRLDNVNVSGISDIHRWLRIWNFVR
jgi:hypothetical protein